MEKRHRIFVAINLPNEIKRELFLYSQKWPELPAKWTAKDNLHITLEFLGSLTEEELGEVCVIVKEVAERHSCFSLNINKILYGPPKKKNHLILVRNLDTSGIICATFNGSASSTRPIAPNFAGKYTVQVSLFNATSNQ